MPQPTNSDTPLKMNFSFFKDPVASSQQSSNFNFWEPQEFKDVPTRVCGKIQSNDKLLFVAEYARRLYVFSPFKAQDIHSKHFHSITQKIHDTKPKLLCYDELRNTLALPRKPIDPPIVMTQENFENDTGLWKIACSKSPSVIRFFHMNGFELIPGFDSKEKKVCELISPNFLLFTLSVAYIRTACSGN